MIIVRRMEPEDVDTVCSIEERIFSFPWQKHDFIDSIKSEANIYLVAIHNNEIVGYCGLWTISEEGHINNVAVREDMRDQKIGTLLMNELIRHGKLIGISDFTLEVRVSNKQAIKLYTNLGFEVVGTRKNFYQKPIEDGLIMWLNT